MRFRSLCAALAAVVVVGACGGGSDSGGESQSHGSHMIVVTEYLTNPNVQAGDPVYAVARVINGGDQPSGNVHVDFALGEGLTLTDLQCQSSDNASCPSTLAQGMDLSAVPAHSIVEFYLELSTSTDVTGAIKSKATLTAANEPANDHSSSEFVVLVNATPTASTPSYVHLQSTTGDYIGHGQVYSYTQSNSTLTVDVSAQGVVTVKVAGAQNWQGQFQMPNSGAQLLPGTYGATRYPFNGAVAGMDWSGEGRGCNTITGQFKVDNAVYTAGALTLLDLRFEQHCEGLTPALYGQIHLVN